MTKRLSVALLGLLGLPCASVDAALPGGISGPWYNPTQSGHGLSVELIDGGESAIVIWNVYTPGGEPLNLYVETAVDGRRLDGQAYAPRGMRFGRFDPSELALPSWGRVWLDFSSCDRATLNWASTDASYGAGSMPIERLARLDGLECALPPPNDLPVGLVRGEYNDGRNFAEEGFLDKEGRLWGLTRGYIPGPAWVGSGAARFWSADPIAADAREVSVKTRLMLAGAFGPVVYTARGTGRWTFAPTLRGEFASLDHEPVHAVVWTPDAALAASLVTPASRTDAMGTYTLRLRDQFVENPTELHVRGDGSVCIEHPHEGRIPGFRLPPSTGGCWFSGTLSDHEGDIGLLSFRLQDNLKTDRRAFRGRAWLKNTAQGQELVMVGDNRSVGLVAFATRAATATTAGE